MPERDPKIKITITANSSDEARERIAGLHAEDFNYGDQAEVVYPNGEKHIYVFENRDDKWQYEYVIRPED